ncbi:hypothetical protein D8L93_09830 [Sodalis-like symbiont of Bactericera trigonica]|nr:hypothetical protein D8L93_09830 [Sodalis-like symbiont of Bactericera trigonica]
MTFQVIEWQQVTDIHHNDINKKQSKHPIITLIDSVSHKEKDFKNIILKILQTYSVSSAI